MLEALIGIGLLMGVPVLAILPARRVFLILIGWLLIAPVASNLVERPGTNPFFAPPTWEVTNNMGRRENIYLDATATVTGRELLNPTRALFSVIFVVFLLRPLLRRRTLGLDRTETWMLAFAIILIVNVLGQSWRLAHSLRVAADAFIIPFVAYALLRRLVTSEERFRQLVRILGYIGFYIIIIALFDRLTHEGMTYRVHGPFRSNQTLQVVLAVAFFALWSERPRITGLSGLKYDGRYRIRQFVLFFVFPIVFLTWSRGNVAGFLTAVSSYLLLGRRLIHPMRKFGAIGLALVVVPMMAIVAAGLEPSEAGLQRITNVATVESRLTTWARLIQETITAPIFGIGLNNLRNYLAQDWRLNDTVHNCYLGLFIELGAVGLLSYLMIVISIIWAGIRLARVHPDSTARWRGIAIVAVMVAHQVPSLFANNLYLTELGHVLVFAFVGAVVGRYERYRSQSNPFVVPKDHRQIAPALAGFRAISRSFSASDRRSVMKSTRGMR